MIGSGREIPEKEKNSEGKRKERRDTQLYRGAQLEKTGEQTGQRKKQTDNKVEGSRGKGQKEENK